MSQDQITGNMGLLPPPPLLPSQPLPLPPVSMYHTPTSSAYPPPLPPPPHVYHSNPNQYLPNPVQGYINPYQSNIQGGLPQHYGGGGHGGAPGGMVNPAMYVAAASQMMIGNMLDHMSNNNNKRKKRRSGSPKRRTRSRSESPPRNRRYNYNGNRKRRRRTPPYYKNNNAQAKKEEPSPSVAPDKDDKDGDDDYIFSPPTPETKHEETNIVHEEEETGNKTPDYVGTVGDDGPPKTPEYDAVTGSAMTPPSAESRDNEVTSTSKTENIVSLKKIREESGNDNFQGVKSLTDILREQALKSMMKKKQQAPETSPIRTLIESPVLDRSTTDSAKLIRPFDDVDDKMFQPEDCLNDDFYSDEEFDPEKYNEVSDENLLDSPNKRDLTGLTMNFTVGKQKVTKQDRQKRKLAKLEKKRLKELRKKKKEEKKLKKHSRIQAEGLTLNNADEDTNSWQRAMISNLVTDNNNEEEEVTPPGTPNEDEAETLKTPEKCDDILFEFNEPEEAEVEALRKKKPKRKVVVLNKDNKPEEPKTISAKPVINLFTNTIRSLVNKDKDIPNTDKQTKPNATINPFSQSPKPTQVITPITAPSTTKLPVKRLGGLKTIKIRKTPQPSTSRSTSPKVQQRKEVLVPKTREPVVEVKPTKVSRIDSCELDDIDKELAMLNEAINATPATTTYKPKTNTVFDDEDDLFADIEEILNEERRNLK